jgi:hypothetical protein
MIPIWIDGGYRLNPHAYLGAYLHYGIGFVNASAQVPCRASGAHCSASDVLFGVDLLVHFAPAATLDPWLGFGLGYEALNVSTPNAGMPNDVSYSGFQFLNVQLGGDFRVRPEVAVGPFATLAVAQYADCSNSGSPSMCAVGAKTTHEVFVVGVRGTYDIRVK